MKTEQKRLEQVISQYLSLEEQILLDSLLEKPNDGMYLFTQLQKEPRSFKYHQIRTQLKYANQLKPIYKIVLRLYSRAICVMYIFCASSIIVIVLSMTSWWKH